MFCIPQASLFISKRVYLFRGKSIWRRKTRQSIAGFGLGHGPFQKVGPLYSVSLGVKSFSSIPIKLKVHPGERLSASILRSHPQIILDSASDPKQQAELTESISQRLDLPRPAQLARQYEDTESYYKTYAALVAEEARYTIASAMEAQLSSEKPMNTVSMRFTKDCYRLKNSMCDRLEFSTHRPLSRLDRKNIRPGAVVGIFPREGPFTVDQCVFATIHSATRSSVVLPCHMQDKKKETVDDDKLHEKEKKTKTKKKGDIVTMLIYDSNYGDGMEIGNDVEMLFIVSILNFQRQFAGCTRTGRNSIFGGNLLGLNSDCGTGAAAVSRAIDSGEDSEDTELTPNEVVAESRISLPALNEKQQEASDDFLASAKDSISIVQGPPGTGKTTMLVATICRYILESKKLGFKRKLLVCGPTNKSVVVLGRQVLRCIGDDEATNVAIIGEKEELLSDHRHELEPSFVFSFVSSLKRSWAATTRKFLKTKDYATFDYESRQILSKMTRQAPATCPSSIKRALIDIAEAYFEHVDQERDSEDAENEGTRLDTFMSELENIYFEEIQLAIHALDEQKVVKDLLNSADVVFCTLSTAGCMPMKRMQRAYDLIVDEASAATEAELMIPLHTQPNRLLLVGDPRQLPATVQSPLAQSFGLGKSLQERLMHDCQFEYTMLDVQYRMRREISQWPVSQFYSGRIKDGDNVALDSYQPEVPILDGSPYIWVHVPGEEQKDKRMSTFNEPEAHAVVSILLELQEKSKHNPSWFSPDKVRVITFYKGQVDLIRQLAWQYRLENIMVSTLDSSQGCEADIVIVSFVRGASGHVGFLKDNRRLNVGLTRAKHQQVCVGNIHAIAGLEERGGNFVLRDMANDAINRDAVLPAPGPLPPPPTEPLPSAQSKKKKFKKKKRKPKRREK